MTASVLEKYRQAPHSPGVYLMKNTRGRIIYVGKAKNLKKRLAAYFAKKEQQDPKTAALIDTIKDFEIIITASDHEAFILESNFIKEHNPKYNVILKDGKNYPLLRIDMNKTYPNIEKVRKIKEDQALYFGPYSSSSSMNRTVKQIQKIFKLRQCKDTQFKNRSRPCLNFQIKACLGLCCNDVDETAYKKQMQDAILFLKGKSGQVIQKLHQEMMTYSKAQAYEKAAQTRDTISAVKRVMEKQVVVSSDMKDRDIVTCAAGQGSAVITLMMVRSGCLIDTAHYHFEQGLKKSDEILSAFLLQYYRHHQFLPPFILVNQDMEEMDALAQIFSEKRGKKVVIHQPVRGEKRHLVVMAEKNGMQELNKKVQREKEQQAAVIMLQKLLKMDDPPSRIECFDNSNLSGQDPVSAMVIFQDGRPFKKGYRKFIIRDLDFQDDYACMFQVLERRFSKTDDEMPFPDLLVVDGGKGQLSMALAVIRELDLETQFSVAGLAKKNEAKGETQDKIYIPGRANPLNTHHFEKALYLLQQIRDEAHRFAITFQRNRREKRAGLSGLDSIPGIGPKRRRLLLRHFKGTSRIKKATVEELASLPGISRELATKIHLNLNDHGTG